MIIEVDPSSPTPPYEQIRSQIARMIGAGVLEAGERLPTIAQLANDLGLANGTVARAYRELEAEDLVTSRRRTGTVVAAAAARLRKSERDAALAAAVDDLAVRLRQLGATPDDVIEALRARWGA